MALSLLFKAGIPALGLPSGSRTKSDIYSDILAGTFLALLFLEPSEVILACMLDEGYAMRAIVMLGNKQQGQGQRERVRFPNGPNKKKKKSQISKK